MQISTAKKTANKTTTRKKAKKTTGSTAVTPPATSAPPPAPLPKLVKGPFNSKRNTLLTHFSTGVLTPIINTGVLFDTKRVATQTAVLGSVCQQLGGPKISAMPVAPDDCTAMAGACDFASQQAPQIATETQIPVGTLPEMITRSQLCKTIAINAAEAKNQGLDALRISNGLAQSCINAALTYIRGSLEAAKTTAERQQILMWYGPFIAAINDQLQSRQDRGARQKTKLAQLQQATDQATADVQTQQTVRKIRAGQTVTKDEALAAARNSRKSPR